MKRPEKKRKNIKSLLETEFFDNIVLQSQTILKEVNKIFNFTQKLFFHQLNSYEKLNSYVQVTLFSAYSSMILE